MLESCGELLKSTNAQTSILRDSELIGIGWSHSIDIFKCFSVKYNVRIWKTAHKHAA